MRRSVRGVVLAAWVGAGCGGAGSAERSGGTAETPGAAAERASAGDEVAEGRGELRFEPELVTCAPDRVARPAAPAGGCTEGVSTYVSVHRRVRERLDELASSCAAEGEIVLRFALRADGRVEAAEIVASEIGEDDAARALELLRTVQHCPPAGGARTVVTVPLRLRTRR